MISNTICNEWQKKNLIAHRQESFWSVICTKLFDRANENVGYTTIIFVTKD